MVTYRPAELGEPRAQRLLPPLVALQGEIAVAVDVEERVVEAADRAGRVAVAHPGGDRLGVHGLEQRVELGHGGDAQLEEQPRHPGVVVGS